MAFTAKFAFPYIASALVLVSLAITSPKANARVVIAGKTVNSANVTGTARCTITVTGPCIPSLFNRCKPLSRVTVGVTFQGNQIASSVTKSDGSFAVIVNLARNNISCDADLFKLQARIHYPITNCSIYPSFNGYLVGLAVPQIFGITGDVVKLTVPSMRPSI